MRRVLLAAWLPATSARLHGRRPSSALEYRVALTSESGTAPVVIATVPADGRLLTPDPPARPRALQRDRGRRHARAQGSPPGLGDATQGRHAGSRRAPGKPRTLVDVVHGLIPQRELAWEAQRDAARAVLGHPLDPLQTALPG